MRYGHDRLYVQAADGTRLGYVDNKTGATVLEDESHRVAFDAAVAAYRSGAVPVIPRQPTVAALPRTYDEPVPAGVPLPESASAGAGSPLPQPAPGAAGWQDLAATTAGAAAREQAVALRRAAPVKTFLARALGVKTPERAWRIGADGEQAVAARLARLGDRWKILHAVPVGENGCDIDHVVIGPGGVFTINTKHHPNATVWVGGNTVMVNGNRTHYVRNSRFEAKRTAAFLTTVMRGTPVLTTGLIAVMGARGGLTIKSQPADGGVVVLARKELATWLAKRPEVLTDERVEAIHAVARRSDTWRKRPGDRTRRA